MSPKAIFPVRRLRILLFSGNQIIAGKYIIF
jgi:hypothetical protein